MNTVTVPPFSRTYSDSERERGERRGMSNDETRSIPCTTKTAPTITLETIVEGKRLRNWRIVGY